MGSSLMCIFAPKLMKWGVGKWVKAIHRNMWNNIKKLIEYTDWDLADEEDCVYNALKDEKIERNFLISSLTEFLVASIDTSAH